MSPRKAGKPVLVFYLEQWLAQPDLPPQAPVDEQALNEPHRGGIEHWAPDLSVEAGTPYLPPAQPLASLDPRAAPVSGHRFTVLSRRTRRQ